MKPISRFAYLRRENNQYDGFFSSMIFHLFLYGSVIWLPYLLAKLFIGIL